MCNVSNGGMHLQAFLLPVSVDLLPSSLVVIVWKRLTMTQLPHAEMH